MSELFTDIPPELIAAAVATAWLTKEQGAEYAQVSVRTISRWIREGRLRAGGGPGVVRIKREWLDEMLERRGERVEKRGERQ